jgi:hypothetical protein
MAELSRALNDRGQLVVRLSEPFEDHPKIDGWKAWWLNRVGTRTPDPQRVTYRRVES